MENQNVFTSNRTILSIEAMTKMIKVMYAIIPRYYIKPYNSID